MIKRENIFPPEVFAEHLIYVFSFIESGSTFKGQFLQLYLHERNMKIAIIGAGPGGLYAALTAARQNIQVDLFEKRKIGEGIIDSLGIMAQPGKGLLHPVQESILQEQGQYVFPLGRYRNLWMLDRRDRRSWPCLAKRQGVAISKSTKKTRPDWPL